MVTVVNELVYFGLKIDVHWCLSCRLSYSWWECYDKYLIVNSASSTASADEVIISVGVCGTYEDVILMNS